MAPRGQPKRQKALGTTTIKNRKAISTIHFQRNQPPRASRTPGSNSSFGKPASSVPAGQKALQYQGSPATPGCKKDVANGAAITNTASRTYLSLVVKRGRRNLSVGILESKSWRKPKGQSQPQMNRPKTTPDKPIQPTTYSPRLRRRADTCSRREPREFWSAPSGQAVTALGQE